MSILFHGQILMYSSNIKESISILNFIHIAMGKSRETLRWRIGRVQISGYFRISEALKWYRIPLRRGPEKLTLDKIGHWYSGWTEISEMTWTIFYFLESKVFWNFFFYIIYRNLAKSLSIHVYVRVQWRFIKEVIQAWH